MVDPWVEGGYYEEYFGMGVERTQKEKEQRSDSRTSWKKSEIKKYNKYKQEKKRVTYTNEERSENSKVKEYDKLGEIKL